MNYKTEQKIIGSGMDPSEVKKQLEHFKDGFPFLAVEKAATIGDGIISMSNEELKRLTSYYDAKRLDLQIVKFVPASGAASRMFKSLFAYLEEDEIEGSKDEFIQQFIKGINNFGFADAIDKVLRHQNSSIEQATANGEYHKIVSVLLNEEGLNYGKLPKGLLLFHNYKNEVRTPVAEHFSEGMSYAVGQKQSIRIHFTVSPEHLDPFKAHVSDVKNAIGNANFEVGFSIQKKATDTIAVTMDNMPFENEDGSLLFRPAGHGALLDNLDEIDADLIFVKNIDNVVPDKLKEQTIVFKKVIAGLLLSVQDTTFKYLNTLDEPVGQTVLAQIATFVKDQLQVVFPENYNALDTNGKINYLKAKLNRPIRVCGMVKNTGEPGGGPFWVKEKDGSLSLQIAETSQLNMKDEHSVNTLDNATHFNPVDLVCGIRNYKGEKFNLLDYRDPETGFITIKSKNGRELKAMELPGLWNGAMANWTTLFVEVPLITFNPVKTVNDLLRTEHQ